MLLLFLCFSYDERYIHIIHKVRSIEMNWIIFFVCLFVHFVFNFFLFDEHYSCKLDYRRRGITDLINIYFRCVVVHWSSFTQCERLPNAKYLNHQLIWKVLKTPSPKWALRDSFSQSFIRIRLGWGQLEFKWKPQSTTDFLAKLFYFLIPLFRCSRFPIALMLIIKLKLNSSQMYELYLVKSVREKRPSNGPKI